MYVTQQGKTRLKLLGEVFELQSNSLWLENYSILDWSIFCILHGNILLMFCNMAISKKNHNKLKVFLIFLIVPLKKTMKLCTISSVLHFVLFAYIRLPKITEKKQYSHPIVLQDILQSLFNDANYIFYVKIFDLSSVFACWILYKTILSWNRHKCRFNVNQKIRNIENNVSTRCVLKIQSVSSKFEMCVLRIHTAG